MQLNVPDMVFLLDDSQTTNYMHSDVLLSQGLAKDVIACTDPDEAMEALRTELESASQGTVLLLVDIHMPGKSGFEFLDDLEEEDLASHPRLTIVMLTSSSLKRDIEVWQRYPDVKAFIQKPLDEHKVRNLLEGSYKNPLQ